MLYTTLFFLPGAAGHFISRCLSLLPDVCCFVNPATNDIPRSLEEKVELFSYKPWHSSDQKSWIKFENQLPVYLDLYKHTNIAQTGNKIFHRFFHPSSSNMSSLDLRVEQASKLTMCVDTTRCFKWVVANSCWKNHGANGITIELLENEKKLLSDPSVVRVDLSKIVSNRQTFLEEFYRVAAILNHDVVPIDHALLRLWREWKMTTYSVVIV